jgi:hypothetical protein
MNENTSVMVWQHCLDNAPPPRAANQHLPGLAFSAERYQRAGLGIL